jgi:hypothetical protein
MRGCGCKVRVYPAEAIMDYWAEERKYKQIISKAMGDDFVDAIFEGTTSDTSRSGFLRSLEIIAANCHIAEFGVGRARSILENRNPGKEYNGLVFQGYAEEAIKNRRSYVDFQI